MWDSANATIPVTNHDWGHVKYHPQEGLLSPMAEQLSSQQTWFREKIAWIKREKNTNVHPFGPFGYNLLIILFEQPW